VIEGSQKLYDQLLEMESRSDEGWAVLADKNQFEKLAKQLDAGETKLKRIRKEDPFRLTAAAAETRFRHEKVSTQGTWKTIVKEPYIFFVQEKGKESEEEIRKRLKLALEAADQFSGFFRDEFAEPLALKRTLPSGLAQADRASAPLELLLFRNTSYWRAYLESLTDDVSEAVKRSEFIEPGSGRTGMVYDEEKESFPKFLHMLAYNSLYNHYPDAPKTRAEAKSFTLFNSYMLQQCMVTALASTSRSSSSGEFTFFSPRGIQKLLQRLRQPFRLSSTGRGFYSFGGPAFTAKQVVKLTKWEDATPVLRANLESYEGWDDSLLKIITSEKNTASLMQNYMHAVLAFAYNYEKDGSAPYRDKVIKFIRMDLDGEATGDKQLPAFEKALGLDENGWKEFEDEFAAWQTGT
jgi:hypothetical protein